MNARRNRTKYKIDAKEASKHSVPALPRGSIGAVYRPHVTFRSLEDMERNKDQAIIQVHYKRLNSEKDFEFKEVSVGEKLKSLRKRAVQLFNKYETVRIDNGMKSPSWGPNGTFGTCEAVCGHLARELLCLIDGYLSDPDTTSPSQLVEMGRLSCLMEVAHCQAPYLTGIRRDNASSSGGKARREKYDAAIYAANAEELVDNIRKKAKSRNAALELASSKIPINPSDPEGEMISPSSLYRRKLGLTK